MDPSAIAERLTGTPVVRRRSLAGGDVSTVVALDMADGRRLVAKLGGPVAGEARMLRAIAATGCPTPEIVGSDAVCLLMGRLPQGRASDRGWAEAGRAIARLHATTGRAYGWKGDHAIGAAVQPGGWDTDWPRFWGVRRLLAWPTALPVDLARRLERLALRLSSVLPARPPASLLHGDLWTGNLIFDDRFQGLIDPACYHGDAEVDLASLTAFGSPPEPFWTAYGALRDGWQERRPIYRLWIALLHLRLFGAGYRGMVASCLDAADA